MRERQKESERRESGIYGRSNRASTSLYSLLPQIISEREIEKLETQTGKSTEHHRDKRERKSRIRGMMRLLFGLL